ncbi:glycogen debranching N-terminal domain-containing protein [Georgenia muralis]|uniref:Glycogen debranching enzyme n=1 Tax=Georgenia muralis TaxID=154117 RepID=A0A3N4Z3F1_9MICO|nr:glycogen debranching N-terminal domain-containing protein [Georgenia muralis]RPF27023.1 glycogen debranching enzyme [Georgenia muralis]
MSGSEVLVRAGTMLLGGPDGSVGEETGAAPAAPVPLEGLYVADTRCLSRWVLRADGEPLDLAGTVRTPDRRTVALVPRTLRNVPPGFLLVREQTARAGGLGEVLTVRAEGETRAVVVLDARTDFADPFELRSDGRTYDHEGARAGAATVDGSAELTFARSRAGRAFARLVLIRAEAGPGGAVAVDLTSDGAQVVGARLTWVVELPAGGTATLQVDVDAGDPADGPAGAAHKHRADRGDGPPEPAHGPAAAPGERDATTDIEWLRRTSLADLDCLLMPAPGAAHLLIPAAGVPWFLTLFARDSLLTAMMVQAERPAMLPAVVEALALHQGSQEDPARVEQPGKIPHEVRISELATLGQVPYGRYYGSVDSTALYLMGLGRLGAAQEGLVRHLEGSARSAVAWLRGPGGLDETGFVRYVPDPRGLRNQGWKDSSGAIAHPDATPADGAIALCEVQGYTWRALADTARLARTVWGDAFWAEDLETAAAALRERFRAAFWPAGSDFPALALDGTGRPVTTPASNAGHLLWSGMLTSDEARVVGDRLLGPGFFTGWGLRTVEAGQAVFSALSYHRGSVWPHDTMLAAAGLAAYGLHDQARRLARGTLDAARHVGGHLPELFGGNTAADFPAPLVYARAGVPQAWSAAAGVVAAQILGRHPPAG